MADTDTLRLIRASPFFSQLVVMAMGVRVTCVDDNSGPGKTKAIGIISVEIVESFVDSIDSFMCRGKYSVGCEQN